MPNIHPTLIHFPIALLTVSIITDIAGKVLNNQSLTRTGWWTLVIGFFGLTLAIATGLFARGSVAIPEPAASYIDLHAQVAFLVTAIFAILLFWRIRAKGDLPHRYSWGYLSLALVGVVLMWMGAWYGGEMVYRFGVGVTH